MNTTETIDISVRTVKEPSRILALNSENGTYETVYKRYGDTSDIRLEADLKDLPVYVGDAFISVEDERFYEHCGIDYKRTFAALANEFLNFYGRPFRCIGKHSCRRISEQNHKRKFYGFHSE